MVQWCWVNFQCRGVLLIWILVGQGPIVLAVGAGGGCLDIFSLVCQVSLLSPSLWKTARYRLNYCLNRAVKPQNNKQTIYTNCNCVLCRANNQLMGTYFKQEFILGMYKLKYQSFSVKKTRQQQTYFFICVMLTLRRIARHI